MTSTLRAACFSAALIVACVASNAAIAGPPFLTDDPQPTDTGHWEIYNFVQGAHTPVDTSGEAGLDLNYGAAKNLQLTAVLPAQFSGAHGQDWGMGDIELAAKYKFLHQDGFGLDVAIFPRAFVPSAYDRHGDRHTDLLVPIWLEKDYGKWQVFGGGGYQFHAGPGARNFWVSGVTVARQVTDNLMLGAEVYHQTADSVDGRDFTVVNFAGQYKFAKHWSLLLSAGPGVEGARENGQTVFYTSLKADY